jgi:hypothetical protein
MANRSSVEVFEGHVRLLGYLLFLTIWPVLAVYSYLTLPTFFEDLARLHLPLPTDEEKSVHALVIIDEFGKRAGWLHIRYSEAMEVGKDASFDAIYKTDISTWGRSRALLRGKLVVSVWASSLEMRPEPREYTFDNQRILRRGADNRIWTVVADKNGHYNITVRFTTPPSTKARGVHVNGVEKSDVATEFVLPVTVSSSFKIETIIRQSASYVGSILSFLLALPLAGILLTHYLRQRNQRRKKKKPVVKQTAPNSAEEETG